MANFDYQAEGTLGKAKKENGQSNAIIPAIPADRLPIVGIGGSAGSIPALQAFFSSAPSDSGMAYVVILHLSPEHESTLASVLQRNTSMPVIQVMEKTKVEPNTVYVIPPAKQLSMVDGYLILEELSRLPGRRVAVDLFFRALADLHGSMACAIVLSGIDSDGAIGIKRIKEMGGLTIAQDPNEAQFEGMPRAAIATGMVDWILPVGEMASRLLTYRANAKKVRLPSEEEPSLLEQNREKEVGDESTLTEVLSFLRTSTGRDFSYYKRATILRRIARRMQVSNVLNLPDYLSFLKSHPEETGAVLQDLLISVTNFFRDKAAFQTLESDLHFLFEGKKFSDFIRVWVPGCATGEEAYSVGILLSEYASTLSSPPRIQIFATDLDENALNAARGGAYPETIVSDVSEERLRRFFIKEHQIYRIKRSLREVVLFAAHDLLKDFPFSRIDLISCRNLLIYLNRHAQKRAFEIFHFALRPEGRLFLGSSESGEEAGSLFFPIDKKARLYARSIVPRPPVPVFSNFGSSTPISSISPLMREGSPAASGTALHPFGAISTSAASLLSDHPSISWTEMHLKLIEQIAPPSVVVNQNYDIVHLSKNIGQYLQFGGGEPTVNLLQLVNPLLRIDLRSALYRAGQTGSSVELPERQVEIEGVGCRVDISVKPITEISPLYFIILFNKTEETTAASAAVSTMPSPTVTHLEEELEHVKGQLRDSIEQFEIGSEELRSSNEELQAINEELRSATEELETSREELQSMNEELTTVNQELKSKVEEVSRSNGDLQNLMSSTNIATIFLDRKLQIKRYTPAAIPFFNLIHSDIGRPLFDLKARFDYPSLSADALSVLDTLSSIEREIHSGDGRHFLARLFPYRTTEDQIAGVVLTFIEITQIKQSEEALRSSRVELAEELESMRQLHEITMRLQNSTDLATALREILVGVTKTNNTNLGSIHLYDRERNGLNLAAAIGFGADHAKSCGVINPIQDSTFARAMRSCQCIIVENCQIDSPAEEEGAMARALGYKGLLVSPLTTRQGEFLGIMSIHFQSAHTPSEREVQRTDLYARQAADLIERKQSEEALRNSEERVRFIINQATVGIGQVDMNGRILFTNPTLCQLLDQNESELLGKNIRDLIPCANHPEYDESLKSLSESRKSVNLEKKYIRRNGSSVWISLSMAMTRDAGGNSQSILIYVTDITQKIEDQRNLKEALIKNEKIRMDIEASVVAKDRFLATLSHELRTPLTPVLVTVGSLLHRPDISQRIREGLEMIQRNIQVEAHFIDDLLDVTRISRNKFEIVRNHMDIHDAIKNAVDISQSDIQGKHQNLILTLEAERHVINGDSPRIQQIIWNVLKNASKFSPDGAEIRLSTKLQSENILIIVSDPGVGIDPQVLPHIFDPFVQGGDMVSREFGGLGLGLAIAKATIDAHDGSLRAESSGAGRGSTFTITLPLLKDV